MGSAVRTAIAQIRAAEERERAAAAADEASGKLGLILAAGAGDGLGTIERGLAGDPAARRQLLELLADMQRRLERLEAIAGNVRVTEGG